LHRSRLAGVEAAARLLRCPLFNPTNVLREMKVRARQHVNVVKVSGHQFFDLCLSAFEKCDHLRVVRRRGLPVRVA